MSERRFQNVAVLMGGPSAEREISLCSGQAVARGLREAGYTVTEVVLAGREVNVPTGTEAVFIALHGEFGEDGEIQRILDGRGLVYTGSGPGASRRSFDKALTKRILEEQGILTPAYQMLESRDDECRLAFPVVVKPTCQGSTIGISCVQHPGEWRAAVEEAFKHGAEVLVETYIPGRELTVGIVGREVLPVVEIIAPNDWYDKESKYTKGVCKYLVPAPLDEAVTRRCQSLAMRTFQALGCRGMGRVDLRLNGQGEAFVLELNNIPGFTETSLLPKAAACAGIGFSSLCDRIIRAAACGEHADVV